MEKYINNNDIFNNNTKNAWTKLILLIAENLCTGIRIESIKVRRT